MGLNAAGRLYDASGLPLFSLLEINALPQAEKEAIYGRILPEIVFSRFHFDRQSFRAPQGGHKIAFICPTGLGLLRIEVRRQPQDKDCLFFVEMADTPYRQIELSFCLINDPDAPRFAIDVDPQGRENAFGTLRRNIPEEIRAMEAGLSPCQVRAGLKTFKDFFRRFETFVAALCIDSIVAEPLTYSNAIRYENYGFDYISGKQLMFWIDREFRPGGELYRRLDGSTPFRRPEFAVSVRGRSWAIHDGILPQPWDNIKIYKTVGVDAGVNSFPDPDRRY
ncbi:MAG: hypothetical protein RBR03_05550 [Desulfuromonas thiophila]|jgi:hypothetical protein|nr:hypothetical protein [Desulfuromonas thiophila]